MKINTIIFPFLLLIPSLIFAQSNFNIDYDYSRMCIDDTSGYIEIYYSFRPLDMKTTKTETDTTVTGVLNIKIVENNKDKVVVDRTWEFDSNVGKNHSNSNSNLVGLLRFILPKGKYSCDIKGQDGNDSLKQSINSFDFDIKPLNDDRFTISDLQLASSIKKVSETSDSPFYKNHYEVIPNPGLIFGDQLPVVYLYCEIYGLNNGVESETLQIEYVLVDSKNQELVSQSKFIPSSVPSMVFVKTINIRKFLNGRHRVIFTVSDTLRKISEQVSKNFYIFNPNLVDTSDAGVNAIVVASEYFSMSEEEIEEMFAISRYLATDIEINEWERLSNYHDKQVFVYHFWRARDMTPDNPYNEFKEEYLRRAQISNELFYSLNRKGFSTDRGRIYCLYGKPSDIERFPGEFETKPYEIWRYDHIEGGVIFIFADLYGFSDMSLMHSSKLGELRDDDWQREIAAF